MPKGGREGERERERERTYIDYLHCASHSCTPISFRNILISNQYSINEYQFKVKKNIDMILILILAKNIDISMIIDN